MPKQCSHTCNNVKYLNQFSDPLFKLSQPLFCRTSTSATKWYADYTHITLFTNSVKMAYEIAYTAKTNQRHNYATVATEANQTELAQ
jgi:hypothetical protein